MKYFAPSLKIEKIESVDIVCGSVYEPGDDELEILSLRKSSGTIAGGSTVSNIAGSGASNAFSAGDIFGLR